MLVQKKNIQVAVCEQPIPSSECRYHDGDFKSYHFSDLGEDTNLQESIATLVSYCVIHGVGDSAQGNSL